MRTRFRPNRMALAVYAGFIALSAFSGSIGMISGLLPVGASLAERLPFHSPVFGGIALALVVGLPTSFVAALSWRRHPRTPDAAALAGLLLVGWIVVELAIVREFSALQVMYAGAGAGLIALGNLAVLRQLGDVVVALPLFMTAPLWWHWHLRWGATRAEAAAAMPGDELLPVSHFTATRAVTVDAPPEAVWPWLMQAAPMTNPPTPATSFVVADADSPEQLVWAKPDSTWSWTLHATPDGRTRLVTRLRQRYLAAPATIVTVILAEFGDYPMMRKMLLGIKERAETAASARTGPQPLRLASAWRRHGVRRRLTAASSAKDRSAPAGSAGSARSGMRCAAGETAGSPTCSKPVTSPQRLGDDSGLVAEVLRRTRQVPALTWGRDEVGAGEMWNSNSLVAWLIAGTELDVAAITPPAHGRVPGWAAGLQLARPSQRRFSARRPRLSGPADHRR